MSSLTKDNINQQAINEDHIHSLEIYEGIQQCLGDQDIEEECQSNFPSNISFLKLLFQDETCPSIRLEFFEDQEYTLAEIHHEEQLVGIEGCFLIPLNQQETFFSIFRIM